MAAEGRAQSSEPGGDDDAVGHDAGVRAASRDGDEVGARCTCS